MNSFLKESRQVRSLWISNRSRVIPMGLGALELLDDEARLKEGAIMYGSDYAVRKKAENFINLGAEYPVFKSMWRRALSLSGNRSQSAPFLNEVFEVEKNDKPLSPQLRMKKLSFPLCGVALALLTSCGVPDTSEISSKIGDPAPPLKVLHWIQGPEIVVPNGQVTVVDFWATWCPPCRDTIPHLNELYLRNKHRGLEIIAISDERQGKIESFIAKQGENMTFSVAIGSRSTYTTYLDAWGLDSIPQTFVIDADGTFFWQGDPRDPEFNVAVEQALDVLDARHVAVESTD